MRQIVIIMALAALAYVAAVQFDRPAQNYSGFSPGVAQH
jgi:hypothetical protein